MMADIEVCGGVVHAIDTVLLPSCVVDEDDIVPVIPTAPPMEDMEGSMPAATYGGYGRK